MNKTNGLPVIHSSWNIRSDSKGFECVVKDAGFEQLERMVIEAFGFEGEGSSPPIATARSRIFKASSVGIALVIRTNAPRH